MKWIVVGD